MTALSRIAALLLLSSPVLAQAPQPLPADRQKGADTIVTEDLRSWLTTLTSEEFGGRGTGQPGFLKAAQFVRDHFKELGLEPGGDEPNEPYFQSLQWTELVPNVEATQLKLSQGTKTLVELGAQSGLGGIAPAELTAGGPATLLFLTNADPEGLEDVAIAGSVAFVHVRRGLGNDAQRATSEISSRLRRAGATAVVFVDEPLARSNPKLVGSSTPGRQVNVAASGRGRLPGYFVIDPQKLEPALGRSWGELAQAEGLVPLAGVEAALTVKLDKQAAPAFNVIGILRGSDPKLRSEYVVIGSHLDHLGRRGTRYSPGADDDGSGTTGVLAVARALAQNPVRPRRSILFVTFCGEEMGMLGSGYFVKHPLVPLECIVAELQMDMIGRREEGRTEKADDNKNSLHLIGTKKLSMDLHELCLARNKEHAQFDLEWDEEDVYSRSDHVKFAEVGIPIAFFFTGFHKDYHQVTDTVEKIDFEKLGRVARYVYDIAFELAQASGRPLLDPKLWQAEQRREGHNREPVAPLRSEAETRKDGR